MARRLAGVRALCAENQRPAEQDQRLEIRQLPGGVLERHGAFAAEEPALQREVDEWEALDGLHDKPARQPALTAPLERFAAAPLEARAAEEARARLDHRLVFALTADRHA